MAESQEREVVREEYGKENQEYVRDVDPSPRYNKTHEKYYPETQHIETIPIQQAEVDQKNQYVSFLEKKVARLSDTQERLISRVNEIGSLLMKERERYFVIEKKNERTTQEQETFKTVLNELSFKFTKANVNVEERVNEFHKKLDRFDIRNKQLLNQVENDNKNRQEEFGGIRANLELKVESDKLFVEKQNEKNRVMFEELARLNQAQERAYNKLKSKHEVTVTKLDNLQTRIGDLQQANISLTQKNEQLKNDVQSTSERNQAMVYEVEEKYHTISKEQIRLQDSMNKLTTFNKKTADELKLMMESFQKDLTSRINQKAESLGMRLQNEREERVRSAEQITMLIESRDEMIMEKLKYTKEELFEQTNKIDSFVKWDSAKKEEQLASQKAQLTDHIDKTELRFAELDLDFKSFCKKLSQDLTEFTEKTDNKIDKIRT